MRLRPIAYQPTLPTRSLTERSEQRSDADGANSCGAIALYQSKGNRPATAKPHNNARLLLPVPRGDSA